MEDDNTNVVNIVLSPQNIQFILLLIIEILAIPCSIFILIYFNQHLHTMIAKSLRNHSVLLQIIYSFLHIIFDLSFSISSFRLGYDSWKTFSFCPTASIQRHILIFCPQLLLTSSINTILPIWMIVIANIILIVRVIHSSRKVQRKQSFLWKSERKLVFELLIITSLHRFKWGLPTFGTFVG
ncbi:hypothetical protein I4U23_019692 [Adineta vaga]|nr:hypothetical protein I4U23_019692 [Adineta vaga]